MGFLPRYCLLCDITVKQSHSKYLCTICFLKLQFIKEQKQIKSILFYNDTSRELILKAKVRKNLVAAETLMQILIQSDETKKLLQTIDFVMPAPSSVFSRIYGRFDLAWIFAERISSLYRKTFLSPPFRLYWNFKKRSFIKRDQDFFFPPSTLSCDKAPSLLIIDDIVTTGKTLYKVANSLKTPYKIQFLTMACARR